MEYKLQRMDVGVVLLDGERRVAALNGPARRLLGRAAEGLVGTPILDFHPPDIRAKVELLLAAAEQPQPSPAATSMVVALPGRTLVVKVTALPWNGAGGAALLLFEAAGAEAGQTAPAPAPVPAAPPAPAEPLIKLPVSTRQGVALVDPGDALYIRADGHYSTIHTAAGAFLCTLPLAQLEARLDPRQFVRAHRGYIVNLRHARAIERAGDGTVVVMDAPGAPRVPVGRARVEELKRRFAL